MRIGSDGRTIESESANRLSSVVHGRFCASATGERRVDATAKPRNKFGFRETRRAIEPMLDNLLQLLTTTWWIYDPAATDDFSAPYHRFNLVEGAAWFVVAMLIVWRYFGNRKTWGEWLLAGAFVAFGCSDLCEAYALTSRLIVFKAVNLAVIIWLSVVVLRRHYPRGRIV